MTVNYKNVGKSVGLLGAYAWHYGISQVKKELQEAKYSATKKGSSLDTLIQTSGMGEFEMKLLKSSKGSFDFDEINYDPKTTFFPKMNLYKNSGIIIPAASKSPFTYKITTKNNNTDIQIYVKYKIINGSAKVSVGPDKSGVYQVKRLTIYNSSGKRWFSFVPPKRKPKPAATTPTSTPVITPAAKPSP